MPRLVTLVLALALPLTFAPAAGAAQYRFTLDNAGVLKLRLADPGGTDPVQLRVRALDSLDPGSILIFELLQGVGAGAPDAFDGAPAGCSVITRREINCQRGFTSALTRIDIVGGAGDDEIAGAPLGAVPVTINGGDGKDELGGTAADDVLDVGSGPRGKVETASGNGGNDVLRRTYPFNPLDPDHGGVVFDGGSGDDRISPHPVGLGAPAVDDPGDAQPLAFHNRLLGGFGSDTITGSSGRDEIFGDRPGGSRGDGGDTIDALAGDDVVDGNFGDDVIDAGSGDDVLIQGGNPVLNFQASDHPDGADVLVGGVGRDTVDYRSRRTPLSLTPNDQTANDGHPGERDDIRQIEVIRAGSGADSFFGAASLNDGLPDEIKAGSGDDVLITGDGNDVLDGERGVDLFRAGSGNDTLDARDGTFDRELSCGTGDDSAFVDLKDPTPNACERVMRLAITEELNVEIAGSRRLRRRGGSVRVRLACPRAAKAGCRGRVALTGGRSMAYRLRRGRRATVTVAAPRLGRTTLTARQRGQDGPKTTVVQVTVR